MIHSYCAPLDSCKASSKPEYPQIMRNIGSHGACKGTNQFLPNVQSQHPAEGDVGLQFSLAAAGTYYSHSTVLAIFSP
jgi:hypothetical protein